MSQPPVSGHGPGTEPGRDRTCTFPPCSRHAAARSRRCHRVRQSQGWTVTQPRPGWHQWTTPSGRTYTQGPARYPG
jgi:hypothetical protein